MTRRLFAATIWLCTAMALAIHHWYGLAAVSAVLVVLNLVDGRTSSELSEGPALTAERLRLEPGDVLLLQATGPLDREAVEQIKSGVREALPGHQVVVLPHMVVALGSAGTAVTHQDGPFRT